MNIAAADALRRRDEIGRAIDPNHRLVAQSANRKYYLVRNPGAAPEARFSIDTGEGTITASSANAAFESLRTWARGEGKCLLTYFVGKRK